MNFYIIKIDNGMHLKSAKIFRKVHSLDNCDLHVKIVLFFNFLMVASTFNIIYEFGLKESIKAALKSLD